MKYYFILLSFLFIAHTTLAQDIIIKRNGDEISSKVLEVTVETIKYQRLDNPEGPIISILKNEVFMIKYANGTKETFTTNRTTGTYPATSPRTDIIETVHLNGPRIGFTIVSGTLAEKLRDNLDANPFLTQFGWQFETRLFTTSSGTSGLFEFVPLIAGLEQGKFLPSLNGLIGLRSAKGLEVGVGPNISVAGAGIAFAVGTSFKSDNINFPVNIAIVPGNQGLRFSLLVGFNARRN